MTTNETNTANVPAILDDAATSTAYTAEQQDAVDALIAAQKDAASALDSAHRAGKTSTNTASAIALDALRTIEAAEAVAASGINDDMRISLHSGAKATAKSPKVEPAYLDRETVAAFWRGDISGRAATMFIDGIVNLSPAVAKDAKEAKALAKRLKAIEKDRTKITEAMDVGQQLDVHNATLKAMRNPVQRALDLLGNVITDGISASDLRINTKKQLVYVERDEQGNETGNAAFSDRDAKAARQKAKEAAGNVVKRQTQNASNESDKALVTPRNAERPGFHDLASTTIKAIEHISASETPAGIGERRDLLNLIAAAAGAIADLDAAELQAVLDADKEAIMKIAHRAAAA